MNKQIKLYSVDTKAFYNEEEKKLDNKMSEVRAGTNILKEYEIIKYADKLKFTSISDFYIKCKNKSIKKSVNNILKKNKVFAKSKELNEILMSNDYYKEWMDFERKKKNYAGKKSKLNIMKEDIEKLLEIEKDKSVNKGTQADIRYLNPLKLNGHSEIATTNNSLLQAIGAESKTTDIIVIRTLHYDLLHQLIRDGFLYDNDKYIFYTASAGQIRQKKVVFVKESTWNKVENKITCGLTKDMINSQGGMTINKYLAYMALSSTDTTEWEELDINKAIVIPDFEQNVDGIFDYIENKDNELQVPQLNVLKTVKIPFSDGCGMYLPEKDIKNKNFQFRMPWFKGLLTPVDYIAFCDEYNNKNYKVKDIYDKIWDLKADDIKYIFTESQFKMHKYYKDWKQYQDNFTLYECQAGKCNIEEDVFKRPRFCYQMWQTLTDIKDEEIKHYTSKIDTQITNAYTERKTMLKMMGITEDNAHKSYLQKCLELYPELLQDSYIQSQLSDSINKKKKNAESGKFTIDGASTFLLPDIFGWMQWIFRKNEDDIADGLLQDGDVYCHLFDTKKYPKLIVNRSPHLYREHGLRNNVASKEMEKWFMTNGIYTSCHDTLSLLLMFDVDGDHATIYSDQYLAGIVERNMKGVNPLYYEMGKAKPIKIDNEAIYTSITKAFSSSNIGSFSNKITILWNKNNFTSDTLTCIKVLTAMNNYSIDSAKTMEMPTLCPELQHLMKQEKDYKTKATIITVKGKEKEVTKRNAIKLPYFFQFAKDNNNIESINTSTVNRICSEIENIKQGDYDWKQIGKFNKNMLLHSKNIITELDREKIEYKSAIKLYGKESVVAMQIQKNKMDITEKVITKYKELNLKMQHGFIGCGTMDEKKTKEQESVIIYQSLKNEFIEYCKVSLIDIVDAVDIITRYIFISKRDTKKAFLFNVLGEYILDNLEPNMELKFKNTIMCADCGKRIEKVNNRVVRCKECAEKLDRLKAKQRMKRNRCSK